MRAYLRFFGVLVDDGFRCENDKCRRIFLRCETGPEPRYCSRKCEQAQWDRKRRKTRGVAA